MYAQAPRSSVWIFGHGKCGDALFEGRELGAEACLQSWAAMLWPVVPSIRERVKQAGHGDDLPRDVRRSCLVGWRLREIEDGYVDRIVTGDRSQNTSCVGLMPVSDDVDGTRNSQWGRVARILDAGRDPKVPERWERMREAASKSGSVPIVVQDPISQIVISLSASSRHIGHIIFTD